MRNCVVCSTKVWTNQHVYQFSLLANEVCFCPNCWDEIQKLTTPPPDIYDTIVEALGGYTHVVINRCHGGFGLSHEAKVLYLETTKTKFEVVDRESRDATKRWGRLFTVNGSSWDDHLIVRDDPILVQVVKTLGSRANSDYSHLKIVTVPSDVDWVIEEVDGIEWIAERHKIWT